MTAIKFNPWVGDHYNDAPFGKRILVLGESHYEWEEPGHIENWRDVTKVLIQEQVRGGYSKAFWTHIAVMFLNKKPTLDEKGAFWHSVAFYNYVQYSAGDGPRIDPGVEKFKRSEPAFFEILNLLKPQLVITLGDRLWRRLPEEGCEGGVTLAGAETIEACRYRYGTDSCLAMKVRHPSSGFNGRTWNSCITEAIKIA